LFIVGVLEINNNLHMMVVLVLIQFTFANIQMGFSVSSTVFTKDLKGGILHTTLDEKSGRLYVVIENFTGAWTLSAFNLSNGQEEFNIPSATCPSVSENNSLLVYWDDSSRKTVVNTLKDNKLTELIRLPSDSQPCPAISKNGNTLVLDRGFGNDYDDDGYELYAYNLSNMMSQQEINSTAKLIKSDELC
jgi:hypothetical protein